jgi:hypothetical protein
MMGNRLLKEDTEFADFHRDLQQNKKRNKADYWGFKVSEYLTVHDLDSEPDEEIIKGLFKVREFPDERKRNAGLNNVSNISNIRELNIKKADNVVEKNTEPVPDESPDDADETENPCIMDDTGNADITNNIQTFSPQRALDFPIDEDTISIRNRYIVGKVCGQTLFDSQGRIIIKKQEVITPEAVNEADRQGKLAELILNMELPERN